MVPVILLLDADAAVLDALRFCFWSAGFLVNAYRHETGLMADPELLRANGLVISDSLPASDGVALIERLRQREVGAPIILLTDRVTPELRRRAADLAIDCVLEKPLIDDSLSQAMTCLVAKCYHRGSVPVRKIP